MDASKTTSTGFEAFKQSLDGSGPPAGASAPLAALWHAAKGDWDTAHGIVQDDPSSDASWVHAYLHRVEGDLSNAGYWYRRAGKDQPATSLKEEWAQIAGTLA